MKKPANTPTNESLVIETAAAIGDAAEKVAAVVKSVFEPKKAPTRKRKGVGQLPAKNKARLPRREKKALAKKNAPAKKKAVTKKKTVAKKKASAKRKKG